LFVIKINKTGYSQHINILNRIKICCFSSSSSTKKL